jgi:uncharacterized protein (TIGR03382 family)
MRALLVAAVIASAATAHARGAVSITFTSSQAPTSSYAPNNVLAVWIEGPGGTFIKTIDRQALVRVQYLVAWRAKAGTTDMDAVTGATRVGYAAQTVTWNLQDKTGQVVPDGTYTIRMELAQSNAASAGSNNEGTFTFTKNGTASNQTGLANGGFSNVSINYNPTAPACNDGILDSPETCDPGIAPGAAGACPTTCMASGDTCRPNRKNPDPAQACAMTCIVQPIIECKNFDGCCAEGCTEANDSDCAGGGGSGSNTNNPDGGTSGGGTDIGNGCSTGGGASLAFGLLLLASRSTRRRGA